MKIAFISSVHGHKWPGSENLWSECAGKLLLAGHQVLAVVSRDFRGAKTLGGLAAQGMSIQYVRPFSGRWARVSDRFLNPFRHVTAFAPDLIVVSSGSAYDPVYAPPLGKFLDDTGIPFVFACQMNAETFWVDDSMRSIMGRILEKAAATVFLSAENWRITERQLAMKISRGHVIPPPLRLNVKDPLDWPDQSKDAPWRLACVARLEPRWKGQDVLFEVLANDKWKGRNYTLSLFGQGAEEQYLRRLIKYFGLEEQVVFSGFSPDPQSIWSNHHLQVLATRGEGGPMVITEGMMCGRASVTTRCGYNPDYIIDGETGFLAAFATPDCFGQKLEEAWSRRSAWREMGVRAHSAIWQRMESFKSADQFTALIESLKN